MRRHEGYRKDERPLFRLDPVIVGHIVGVKVERVQEDERKNVNVLPCRDRDMQADPSDVRGYHRHRPVTKSMWHKPKSVEDAHTMAKSLQEPPVSLTFWL